FALSGPATAFGAIGTEKVILNTGASGVVVDQNVERVDLPGAFSAFQYQQGGNRLLIYSGSTLLATVPLQGDSDGTQIVATNGSVSAKLGSGGVMTIGGATVYSTQGTVTPATVDASVTSGSNLCNAASAQHTLVFLGAGDSFALNNSATVFGSTGTETVILNGGATGVTVDQNIERVDLPGAFSAFQYQQGGNRLLIYSGATLLATVPLQGDSDGTQIFASDGGASAKLASTGVMSLGGINLMAGLNAITPSRVDVSTASGSVPCSQ
ncbi:MAG: hypothetical protein WCP34_08670, partial [Pseudomonadota bacterium]